MKISKTLLFSCLFIIISFTSFSQETIAVKEEIRAMSKGNKNAFVLLVPQYKADDLKKAWDKYVKENAKVKSDEYKGEYFFLGGIVERLSPNSLNHYATFQDVAKGCIISAYYVVQDSFISSANNVALATSINKFMFDFGKEAYIKVVEKEEDIEAKLLKEKEKELKDLQKDEDDELKSIDKLKNEIEQNTTEIGVKKSEQEMKQKEITMQKEKMLGVSLNPEEKKLQDKLVKEMESEKQKLIKTQSSLREKSKKNEGEIKASERKVVDIKAKQEAKQNEITKQRALLQKVQDKLAVIKKF